MDHETETSWWFATLRQLPTGTTGLLCSRIRIVAEVDVYVLDTVLQPIRRK